MKALIVAGITVLSLSSFANTTESVFKKDSQVPQDLQVRILETLKVKCANLLINYGLTEVSTNVRVDKVDQGITDVYFTTEFSSRYYFDGMHPSYADITVESVQYSYQNGDNLSVLKISSPDICEEAK